MDRNIATKYLLVNHGDLGAKYIREAEHGDGEAYWEYFDTIEELEADYQLVYPDGKTS